MYRMLLPCLSALHVDIKILHAAEFRPSIAGGRCRILLRRTKEGGDAATFQ